MVNHNTPDALVVVGLDFGTAFSGFSYAHTAQPYQVHNCCCWPDANAAHSYSETHTQTSLYYVATGTGSSQVYKLKAWGWRALVNYLNDVYPPSIAQAQQLQPSGHGDTSQMLKGILRVIRGLYQLLSPAARAEGQRQSLDGAEAGVGVFVKDLKLHLAGAGADHIGVKPLPVGLTAEKCITDYLAKMSAFIIRHLQTMYGGHVTGNEVQWCLTVPASWDETTRQKLRICAEMAGLVQGALAPAGVAASPYPLRIFLEPEAALYYCLQFSRYRNLKDDKFLVADVGAGTVDIVKQARTSHGFETMLNAQEMGGSSDGLCGRPYVDNAFVRFLCTKIGCLERYLQQNLAFHLHLEGWWQRITIGFSDEHHGIVMWLTLPENLTKEWRNYDENRHAEPRQDGYQKVVITSQEVRSVLDAVVDAIIRQIKFKMTHDVKMLTLVGMLSASPYLRKRIGQACAGWDGELICPPDPGSAFCHGSVRKAIYYSTTTQTTYPTSGTGASESDHNVAAESGYRHVHLRGQIGNTAVERIREPAVAIPHPYLQEAGVSSCGSYLESEATPSDLQRSVDKVRESLSKFTRALMCLEGGESRDAHLLLAKTLHPDTPLAKKSDVKFLYQSYVAESVFFGFEAEDFQVPETLSDELDWKKKCDDCYMQCKELRKIEGDDDILNELTAAMAGKHTTCQLCPPPGPCVCGRDRFFIFCCRKMEEVKQSKVGRLWSPASEKMHLDLSKKLVSLLASVWLCHLIYFSFQQPGALIKVRKGFHFNPMFMDNVVIRDNYESGFDESEWKVDFMTLPGFRIGKSVVKCSVYSQEVHTPTDAERQE